MANLLITICARGGSIGVPGKNIKEINGIPLIGYTIKTAQEFAKKFKADIGLSTDNAQIKATASNFGITTEYTRPEELATATIGKIPVIEALVHYEEKKNNKKYDYIIDLDITSPLRTVEDLEEAYQSLVESEAYNIFSVSPPNRNPYFNMVEKNEDGYVQLVKSQGAFLTRQLAPEVYDMNASFYIFKKSYFEANFKSSITDKSLAFVMKHICFDIDHPIDFKIMELIFKEGLQNVEY